MSLYQWNGDVLTEWKALQDQLDKSKREWETFMHTGKAMAGSSLAPEILSSWRRCKDRGLNPYDDNMTVLSQRQLEQRLEQNELLIETIRPILQETAGSIRDSGYRIDLYDKDLYLIGRFGRKLKEGDAERREVVLGESHSEKDAGTNATNLAALLEKPISLMAYEHYRTALHSLTCVSAPIMGADGKLMAVITVEGYIWPLHKHTMALLISLKDSIEYRFANHKLGGSESFSHLLNTKLIELVDNPVIIADQGGKIIMANNAAYDTVLEGWEHVIGFSCENIWGNRSPVYDVIKTKKPILNQILLSSSKRFNVSAKPLIGNDGKLRGVIIEAKEIRGKATKQGSKDGLKARYTFENISGESCEIKQVIRLAKETAGMDNNILITGESGTGKELFAQSIHNASLYANGPFVVVNCSAIPSTLLESELFGYEGGAFTGARKEGGIGKFELAVGGTIFLDEINSMSLDMQVKILRVIQNKSIMKVGGNEEIPVNVRIIAATNMDLWKMVKEGQFREDLYYRINVISIMIPPLRDRTGDVEILVRDLLSKISSRLKQEIEIERAAVDLLNAYTWPGNVRELENVLEQSWVIARTANKNCITTEEVLSYRGLTESTEPAPQKKEESSEMESKQTNRTVDDAERDLILKTLNEKGWNIQATAKALGIARNTLYRKIKRYEIERDQ